MTLQQMPYPRIPEFQSTALESRYLRDLKDFDKHPVQVAQTPPVYLTSHNGNLNGACILDIACGRGDRTIELATHCPNSRVIGEDISDELIGLANTVSRGYDLPNLEFRTRDAYRLSEEHGDVSVITMFNGLHHFDRLDDLMAQIAKALKPGGFFFFRDYSRTMLNQFPPYFINWIYDFRNTISPDEYLNMARHQRKQGDPAMATNLILLISYMASYTPNEISQSIRKAGLEAELMEFVGCLSGFALKPER